MKETERGGVDWIEITQNRDQCRYVMNTVIGILRPQKAEISWLTELYKLLKGSAPWR
jgi:hypothetical protein